MSISAPGNPALRIAHAYGAVPPRVAPAAAIGALVAARVTAGVDFKPSASAMPAAAPASRFALYNRSADINEVATGVALGRSIDVRG